jgi:hypothetical protein
MTGGIAQPLVVIPLCPKCLCDVHFSISYQQRCRALFQSYPNLTFRICTTLFPPSPYAPPRHLLYDPFEPYLDLVTRPILP